MKSILTSFLCNRSILYTQVSFSSSKFYVITINLVLLVYDLKFEDENNLRLTLIIISPHGSIVPVCGNI